MKLFTGSIDARGWIGISVFALVLIVLAMVATIPELRQDEFFKTIATLLIGAFVKDVVGWAYTATKQGGELAERAASLAEQQATGGSAAPPKPEPPASEQLPDYARP